MRHVEVCSVPVRYAQIHISGHYQKDLNLGTWSVLMVYNKKVSKIKNCEFNTTRKRMELTAAIKGLKRIELAITVESLKEFDEPHTIEIITDSNYVKKGITKQLHKWKQNNWKTSKGKPVKNKDLWIELDELAQKHTIVCN